jgi:hypothetical protein
MIDAAGCAGGSWVELLANGSFEGGATGWIQSSNAGLEIVFEAPAPMVADTPTMLAWFAGYDDASDELSQSVTVPAGATDLRLRGAFCFETEEVLGAYDFFQIDLRNAGGATAETLILLSNEDVGAPECLWEAFELGAASPHAGETLDLVFHATTDASINTNFFVDSLALEALVCP